MEGNLGGGSVRGVLMCCVLVRGLSPLFLLRYCHKYVQKCQECSDTQGVFSGWDGGTRGMVVKYLVWQWNISLGLLWGSKVERNCKGLESHWPVILFLQDMPSAVTCIFTYIYTLATSILIYICSPLFNGYVSTEHVLWLHSLRGASYLALNYQGSIAHFFFKKLIN